MRAGAVAAIALVAAALGAVAVLAVGRETDVLGERGTRTVVIEHAAPLSERPAALPSLKPLAGNAFVPARIYAARSPGVVTIFADFDGGQAGGGATAQGSGFVVSREGYVLTNSHVITSAGEPGPLRPANRLYVEFKDRDRVPARIVGWDVFNDVGVVKLDPRAHALAPVPLGDSASVLVGEPVAAIGSPFGNESSLAVGVVSATRRSIASLTSEYQLVDAIQTDAPINHGNSGGPLFDSRGRVIGINAQIRSSSGTAEGVGFAVPINSARRSFEQLVATGRVRYAYVGIRSEDVTPSLARRLGLGVARGAAIDSVEPGSGAARAGLRPGTKDVVVNGSAFRAGGDVIVAIDGNPVRGSEDVGRLVTQFLPGQTARFTVVRGGRRIVLAVRFGERPQPAR